MLKKEIQKDSIKFKAKHVLFDNGSGFKIIAGNAFHADSGELIQKHCAVKGQLPDVTDKDEIFATGRWDEHPQYGVGFYADAYVKIAPADKRSILRYLSQGNIPGISKAKAKIIVDTFGESTYRVLVDEAWRLKELKGFGPKTVEKIHTNAKAMLEEQNMVSTLMRYIQGFGISPAYASRIFNRYGIQSMSVLKTNPYRLAEEVDGIGFKKADEIALKNGIPKDSPFRVESAVLYVMQQMTLEGDVYSLDENVVAAAGEFLMLDASYINHAIDTLIQSKRLIREDDALYLTKLYWAETKAAKLLADLVVTPSNNQLYITEEDVKELGKQNHKEYAAEQIDAVMQACRHNVLILTGGPGTGKTTTVNAIIQMFKKHGMKVLCAAPTGKAAKRMKEVTREHVQTIHKLLEVKGDPEAGFKFQRNEHNTLSGDALIIDESSMIDMQLAYAVLRAVPPAMKLIFVGDIDQLPSVGCGNVLHDMIDSGVIPVSRLTEVFRQANESAIIRNARRVNEGVMPDFRNKRDADCFFIPVDNMEQDQIRDRIVTYVTKKLPPCYKTSPENIQVLAPMRRGHTGVEELNDFIQAALNPPSTEKPVIAANGHIIRLWDKIMFVRNDYEKCVFNGDIGTVIYIDDGREEDLTWGSLFPQDITIEDPGEQIPRHSFIVDFDGRKVLFNMNQAIDFELAYATTIHKSQGSEYDIVVMPITNANYVMLQRNLLYTGMTRAKKILVVLYQRQAVARAVRTVQSIARKTRLMARIRDQVGFVQKMDAKTA